jgi:hypothetical protein
MSLLSSNDNSYLPYDSGDMEFSDENERVECLELYVDTKIAVDWIRWLHETRNAQYIHKRAQFAKERKKPENCNAILHKLHLLHVLQHPPLWERWPNIVIS